MSIRDQYPLKDYLNSINFNKENLLEREGYGKHYPPYIINKCLSGFMDTVIYSNEMNRLYNLDKDLQYSFYLNSLRNKKRFSPWQRKEKIEDLDIIKRYYQYSDEKAKDALRILTKNQIELIKSKLNTGGYNDGSA